MLNLPLVWRRWRESVSLGRFQNCNPLKMDNFRNHAVEDELRYPSRQCQVLDFAQVVEFWRDGRYCKARGGRKTVDKPWRTVEFQARVKILGLLENG